MEFPDDIVRHIMGFAKPKLRTKHEWLDFYLTKTEPFRYKVGMKFKILGVIHTIISINSQTITTHVGKSVTFHPLNDYTYFRYKDFEIHMKLQWCDMVNVESSLKKRQFMTHLLLYIQIMFHNQSHPFTQRYNKYIHLIWIDYDDNYANWGAIITGP